MELKPCTCGSTNIKLRLAMRVKSGKGVYCYQCAECGKSSYAWTEEKGIAAELWNDTVKEQHAKFER